MTNPASPCALANALFPMHSFRCNISSQEPTAKLYNSKVGLVRTSSHQLKINSESPGENEDTTKN
jgi:hypothetical protein